MFINQFRSIAFGGGGVRGGLHVGGISALESIRGNLEFPDGVYGSSIGCIVATAVAFGLKSSHIKDMFDKHLNMSAFLPPFRLASIQNLLEKKGLFSMEKLEEVVIKIFEEQGVDLRGKTCNDAKQKLFIVTSNLTSGRGNLLTGSVPVLDAIKCSCCLPFVFQPQVLYNQIYLDGGVSLHYIHTIVPRDCLVFHISQSHKRVFANKLPEMSIMSFIGHIYDISRKDTITPNTLWLQNDSINVLQELTLNDKKLLFDEGFSQTSAFLSKCIPEKLD